MRRINNTAYLIHAFVMIASIGSLSACISFRDLGDDFDSDGRLAIKSTVSEATLVTRAASVEALNEKQLNTLDVFVEHVTDNTGDGTFIKQYHLVASDELEIREDLNLLANSWRAEGLKVGDKYNVYVAVNNTQTKGEKNLETFNVTALKALVADEVTDGLALLEDGTGNIAAPWSGQFADTPSGNIYKQYIPEDQIDGVRTGEYNSIYGYTSQKEFMMDGIQEGWTPDESKGYQAFDVTLNRAAAKIVLNLRFDEDFLHSLTHNKKDVDGTTTWEEKPAAEKYSITGAPGWRFYNFAFGAKVFAPAVNEEGVEVHNSGTILLHPYNFVIDNDLTDGTKPVAAQIVTYTYPNTWAQADYDTAAPSLVISVPFQQNGASDVEYHYYRIPLVKYTTTSIDRNHIYVVNATIATRGSELHEDVDEIEDIYYNVLPWNDKTNSEVIENNVEAVQHLYLKVNPKVYTLRGDGSQSVDITYLKATGTSVKWQLFTFNTTTEAKGDPVESTNTNAVWGWFYDKNGKMKTSYTNLNHMGVTITQSTEGTSGSKGKLTVTSSALDNRAIKYILMRVSVVNNPTVYEDVIIRHIPTDNIQSFTGSWSSYHTGGSSREDTWDPVAAGWEVGTYESEEVEVTASDHYTRSEVKYDGTPSDHDASDYRYEYTTGQNNSTVQTQYRNNVAVGAARYSTDGESNAALGDDGYWYWGTTEYYVGTSGNNYDWRTNRWGNLSNNGSYRYRWTNYYRSKYKKTHYYRTRYYREIVVTNPQTGNWVDWERDEGTVGSYLYLSRDDDPDFNYDGLFDAHIFSNGTVHTFSRNRIRIGDSVGSSYTNNHMYVVQISATSNKYVLGKPILGNPDANRSMDDVVSPAFMIASQLGIVSPGWNSASAAEHCSRYLEVGTDGYRYAGWRLPTDDEIAIINQYQRGIFGTTTIPEADRVMDYVLKGSHYFNLSGGTTPITAYTGNNGNYLRCVRDLSAEEIDKLNGFDAIVNKYQAKNNN